MRAYRERPTMEQVAIIEAYKFEIIAINEDWPPVRNPYYDEIHSWSDGKEVWETIEEAVERHFCDVED